MNIETPKLLNLFKNFKSLTLNCDVDISKLSTMKLKSQGHFGVIEGLDELPSIIETLNQNKILYRMIGWGANQILPEDARDRVYIKLKAPDDPLQFFNQVKESYLLPASLGLNVLVSQALKFGFRGWEVLTGIPASLGGATYMNAGTKFGDISSIINSVYLLDRNGKKRKLNKSSESFSYRKNNFVLEGEIITEVEIVHSGLDKKNISNMINEYMEYRKKTQPLQSNNCGCIFKNMGGVSAGKIIQDAGLKGVSVGGMRVSTLHGNFLENTGGATAKEFWELVSLIQEKVKSYCGKEFELEINS